MAIASFRRPSFKCLATCGAYSFDWLRAWVNVKMRSIATPKDHIDMKKSTKATALATHPICCHIATKSTVHPPSELRLVRLKPDATGGLSVVRLLQCEIHGDGHDDRHRHAVQQRRGELPLFHRFERRRVEQRDRSQHFGFLHFAI